MSTRVIPRRAEVVFILPLLALQIHVITRFIQRLQRCYHFISVFGLIASLDTLVFQLAMGFSALSPYNWDKGCEWKEIYTQLSITLALVQGLFVGLHLLFKSRQLNPVWDKLKFLQYVLGLLLVAGTATTIGWQTTFRQVFTGDGECLKYEVPSWGFLTGGIFVLAQDLCGALAFSIPLTVVRKAVRKALVSPSTLARDVERASSLSDSHLAMTHLARRVAIATCISFLSTALIWPAMALQLFQINHILYLVDATVRCTCIAYASPLPQETESLAHPRNTLATVRLSAESAAPEGLKDGNTLSPGSEKGDHEKCLGRLQFDPPQKA